MIEGFFGGTAARELEREGPAASAAFAIAELRRLLGSKMADGLTCIAASAWAREPTILGSYSHARPGHADARRILAEPYDARIALAGEACSAHDFSTAHGARESGLAAADHVAQALAAP